MEKLWFSENDIPSDLLRRVPTKTLLRLKCVAKEWNRLISSRSFIHSHLLKNKEPVSGFFFQERYQWFQEDIESITYISVNENQELKMGILLDFLPQTVVITASSNGLVCCRTCLSSSHPTEIYVCNPSNKNFVTLKLPSPDIGKSLALAFDPIKDPVDISTNFKVVRVCQHENEDESLFFSFDIYSSSADSWKRSKEICMCKNNLFKNKGVYIKGILYWMTDGDELVMFDVDNELSWLINSPVPSSEFHSIPEMCIGECEGELHYVLVCEQGLQLWVLEDKFASKWELKCLIELEKWEEENPEFLYNVKKRVEDRMLTNTMAWVNPMAYIDGLLLLRVSTDVYFYNFETRKLKLICSLSALGKHSIFGPIVVPYAMSLVPVEPTV